MTSIYIHIPFCLSKCSYCSFSSWPGLQPLHARYVAALLCEAEQTAAVAAAVQPLSSLFLGGGTPTILAGRELVAIIERCRDLFGFTPQAEISVEANPGTVDFGKLIQMRSCGINRLSIGVQSFNNHELRCIGRSHSAEEAVAAVNLATAAGFDNLNLDLMYGLPGQDAASWQQSLELALSLAPTHLSLYELTLEPGTPFHTRWQEGTLRLPEESELVAIDQITADLCARAGFAQYEISNYTRVGCECRHNINYWENGEYLALGAGAVSCVNRRRQRRVSDPHRYCELVEKGQSVIEEEECLEPAASFKETVIMGLRMTQGVSRAQLRSRYGRDVETEYGAILQRLVSQELLELSETHLRLSARGRRFANQVMAELV